MAHPRLLRRESTALVFVDLQERLHREVARKEAVASAAAKLAEAAKILGVPVVLAEHAAKAFGPTIEPLRSALAVARVAIDGGLARRETPVDLEPFLRDRMYRPDYRPYV